MTQTRRERLHLQTIDEIKTAAWQQITEEGVASLSLRAIAREVGITAPGLYHYYRSRDDLVTDLMIEAFNSFSGALETSRDSCKPADYVGRFRAVCKAYFQWAISNPQKYALIFYAPVPGYTLDEKVAPAAQHGFLILQNVIGEAYEAGIITGEAVTIRIPAALKSQYEVLKKHGMPFVPVVTHLALSTWSMIHGMTTLYLYGYFSGFLADQSGTFVELEIEKTIHALGLKQSRKL